MIQPHPGSLLAWQDVCGFVRGKGDGVCAHGDGAISLWCVCVCLCVHTCTPASPPFPSNPFSASFSPPLTLDPPLSWVNRTPESSAQESQAPGVGGSRAHQELIPGEQGAKWNLPCPKPSSSLVTLAGQEAPHWRTSSRLLSCSGSYISCSENR